MIALIVLLFHVLGLLSSIHAVMTTRTAQGAIACSIELNYIHNIPRDWGSANVILLRLQYMPW